MRKKIRWRVLNDEISLFLPKDHQDNEATASVCQGVLEALLFKKLEKTQLENNHERDHNNNFWSNGYQNWFIREFRERLRISRESCEFTLHRIKPFIYKTPTKMVSTLIKIHGQLALTVDRTTHGR